MTNKTQTQRSRHALSLTLSSGLSSVEVFLDQMTQDGITVHEWNVIGKRVGTQVELVLSVSADVEDLKMRLKRNPHVSSYCIQDLDNAVLLELVLINVSASDHLQDEAAALVAASGGRLISINSNGFTAQVSERPDRIESMLVKLRAKAPVESVRSGLISIGRPATNT